MNTRAVVLDAGALATETLELAQPRAGEVLVRVGATGVCHSDLHVLDGDWPAGEPMVLGHEGAGTIVGGPRDGERVVLSWYAQCGHCPHCAAGEAWLCTETRAVQHRLPDGTTPLTRADGTPVAPFLGLGTFAEHVVAPDSVAIAVGDDVPFAIGAVIGCAVTTGVGAVLNTARVPVGASAAVIGCGGVGLAIVLGLRLAGAGRVVAVDRSEERLAVARELGADVTLMAEGRELVRELRRATNGGPDFAFEAIGLPETIEAAIAAPGRGGAAVLVGMPKVGARAGFDPFALADRGKRILGCTYGSSVPGVDFPRLARLYRSGRLPLDALLGSRRPLEEAGAAFDDLRAAAGLRTILEP